MSTLASGSNAIEGEIDKLLIDASNFGAEAKASSLRLTTTKFNLLTPQFCFCKLQQK